jgi:hypothetical protein
MIAATIIFSVLLALILAMVLGYGFSRRGPGPAGGMLFLFLIIFMFTWAIGVWIEPIGPVNWGVPWINYLLVALFIALLLGALIPPSKPRSPIISKADMDEKIRDEARVVTATEITFGFFFWLLMIALFVTALVRILM